MRLQHYVPPISNEQTRTHEIKVYFRTVCCLLQAQGTWGDFCGPALPFIHRKWFTLLLWAKEPESEPFSQALLLRRVTVCFFLFLHLGDDCPDLNWQANNGDLHTESNYTCACFEFGLWKWYSLCYAPVVTRDRCFKWRLMSSDGTSIPSLWNGTSQW